MTFIPIDCKSCTHLLYLVNDDNIYLFLFLSCDFCFSVVYVYEILKCQFLVRREKGCLTLRYAEQKVLKSKKCWRMGIVFFGPWLTKFMVSQNLMIWQDKCAWIIWCVLLKKILKIVLIWLFYYHATWMMLSTAVWIAVTGIEFCNYVISHHCICINWFSTSFIKEQLVCFLPMKMLWFMLVCVDACQL